MRLAAWRVALRIARRDALRAKGRSALVIAMIAVPVLGVTAADVTARSSTLTAQESADRRMGTADASVSATQPGWRVLQAPDPAKGTDVPSQRGKSPSPSPQEQARAKEPVDRLLREALPAGTRLVPIQDDQYLSTSTAYGSESVQVQEVDLADPATYGMVVLRQGAWPQAPYEVSATTGFLSKAGLRVGQSTTLSGTTHPLKITAAIEFPNDLHAERVIGRPGELTALLAARQGGNPGASAGGSASQGITWLVSDSAHAPFTWDDVQRANSYGFAVASRAVLADPPPDSAVPYFREAGSASSFGSGSQTVTVLATVVGMALLEIVLLAGPAFAVGARRSRRQLGLIAATGGNRAHIRGVVLGGGVVLGTAGAVIGIVVGAAAVAVGQGPLEDYAGARFGHFALEPVDLLGIVAVGLVTGLLAALVPAVQASRQDVVASLTGRGAVRSPSKWLAVLGAVALVAGAVVAVLGASHGQGTTAVMGGSVVAELGAVACTPFLVGQFGRLSRWLPLGSRFALRDAARNRGRTAPAVAAVMAAVAGAVAVNVYQASSDAQNRALYTASAPSGAVILAWSSASHLAAQRGAVERSIPGLGQRADVYRPFYKGDCSGSVCGDVALRLPPDEVCPAFASTSGTAADEQPGQVMQLSMAQLKDLARTDPRCRSTEPQSTGFSGIGVGDDTVLHNVLGVHDAAAEQALARGELLVSDSRFVRDGRATLVLTVYDDGGTPGVNKPPSSTTVTVPAVAISAPVRAMSGLMSMGAAKTFGLGVQDAGSVWLPQQVPTSAAEQRVSAAVDKVGGSASVSVERGYQSSTDVIALGLAIAASVVAIGAAAIATGLAAADSQADLATLAAVGAAPRIRRTLSGFQCAVIAAMGAVLGAIAGIVPAAALWMDHGYRAIAWMSPTSKTITTTPDGPLTVPWATLAAIAVGLPLLAWLLAAGFTRSRVVLTRRTD